jgi:hypothetical protein
MPRFARRGDRPLDLGRGPGVDVGEDVLLVVRLDGLERVAGFHVLAADHERNLDALVLELAQSPLQLGALGRTRRVILDRLVVRLGWKRDGWAAHRA